MLENIRKNQLMIDGDYVYFIGKINIGGLKIDGLCRQRIITKKQYILNKNKNLITDSEETFQEYLQKQKEGVRGYKTIKIGIIEKYPTSDYVEYQISGADGDLYWWTDREHRVELSNELKNHIQNHMKAITSSFIKY